MRYGNRILTELHIYILEKTGVKALDQPQFQNATHARNQRGIRTRQCYGIENPTMPQMPHITRHEWRQLGKLQKAERTGKTWQIEDYCRYCTNFLIELPEAIANWKERTGRTTDPCVKCGIRDTIREEQSHSSVSIYRETSHIQTQRGDM